ncbi:MAG: alpha/beta hydrolase, partial [Desulfurellaceae bacterium]|nr:alpha/beta hydrolase [Desulfurellaceae bacterium]
FHYLDWGTAGKPPFVLLHGGAQTAHSWDDFAPVVRTDYHVYALDQRGHGDSGWAADGDYTRHTQADDVAAFVADRGLAPHLLAGLSMGGINAISYTARYPERVRALVVVDVGPEIEHKGQENIQGFVGIDALDSFEAFVERAHRFNPRRSLDNLRQRLSHNLKPLPNQTRRGSGSLRSSLKPEELWQDVGTIRCPTLIVRGGESDILSPAAATRLQAAIPDSRLSVVPGAGHSVMGDNPDGFAAAVQAFLQTLG